LAEDAAYRAFAEALGSDKPTLRTVLLYGMYNARQLAERHTAVDDQVKAYRQLTKVGRAMTRPILLLATMGLVALLAIASATVALAAMGYVGWGWVTIGALTGGVGGGTFGWRFRGRRVQRAERGLDPHAGPAP
jgi:hypothetical protein